MLSLPTRIDLLDKLGQYMLSNDEAWQEAQYRAIDANAWFTAQHISLAVKNIAIAYLQKDELAAWAKSYPMPERPRKVGIVMAGNIPLVGFHDFLCGFVLGHTLHIKLSSKDPILLPHLVRKLSEWAPEVAEQVHFADMLKGCDAYIATGSNNTARYFEQYFGKYPSIIRKNRTSVAILDGAETDEDLSKLADDVFLYFGLGCRNVTQVYVPKDYDLKKLMLAFERYNDYINHNKYKNNYDYYLAIYLLNRVPFLSNDSILVVESERPFSAVSVLHYTYYDNRQELQNRLLKSEEIQCVVGDGLVPFGAAQVPSLNDYADGVDTMAFLSKL